MLSNFPPMSIDEVMPEIDGYPGLLRHGVYEFSVWRKRRDVFW